MTPRPDDDPAPREAGTGEPPDEEICAARGFGDELFRSRDMEKSLAGTALRSLADRAESQAAEIQRLREELAEAKYQLTETARDWIATLARAESAEASLSALREQIRWVSGELRKLSEVAYDCISYDNECALRLQADILAQASALDALLPVGDEKGTG